MHFCSVEDLLGDRLSDARVVVVHFGSPGHMCSEMHCEGKTISDVEDLVLIAYGERC